jgi:hypothetical protein
VFTTIGQSSYAKNITLYLTKPNFDINRRDIDSWRRYIKEAQEDERRREGKPPIDGGTGFRN